MKYLCNYLYFSEKGIKIILEMHSARNSVYKSPRLLVVGAEEEGLLCASFALKAEVDELKNINYDNEGNETFDFEF